MADWVTADDLAQYLDLVPGSVDVDELGEACAVAQTYITRRIIPTYVDAPPDDLVRATLMQAAVLYRTKQAPMGYVGVGDFGPVPLFPRDRGVELLLTPFIEDHFN